MTFDYRLDNLGNVKLGYKNPKRKVIPFGHIKTPNLTLKKYDMYVGEPSSQVKLDHIGEFLDNEIENGRINPRIGLGFTILSGDMLNVVRWDKEYPIVAVNNLYEFSNRDKDYLKPNRLKVDDFGAYCVWELGIVEHERKAWIKYLNSKKTQEDKIKYLFNFLQGEIE